MEKINFEKNEKIKKELDEKLNKILEAIPRKKKEKIQGLANKAPNIDSLIKDKKTYVPSNKFFTNNDGQIQYIAEEIKSDTGKLKLLHEYGHKLMQHKGDTFDYENLKMERYAWLFAQEATKKLGIELTNELKQTIVESFKTYENHMNQRRGCVACGSKNTKEWAPQNYTCKDCFCDW